MNTTEIRYAFGACSLGVLLVAQNERGVCAIWPGDNSDSLPEDLRDRFEAAA